MRHLPPHAVAAACCAAILSVAFPAVFAADVPRPEPRGVQVSPGVRLLQALVRHHTNLVRPGIADRQGFVASLRFARELPSLAVRQLEQQGVVFSRVISRSDVDRVGPIYPAWVPWEALARLEQLPGLRQIDCEPIVRPSVPLDVTRALVHATDLAHWITHEKGTAPGAGVRIGNMDSGIDPFHPAFFHADGGCTRGWTSTPTVR